ncbi:MAG: phytoene desaturase family protein [Promethearchaeota archaeon]
MTDYDVIVIGGGIGGTAVGALLASNKLKTLLVEKNKLIGGRCSTYEKEGFKVDLGVHSFARCQHGPLGAILNKIGMQNAIDWSIAGNDEARWHLENNLYQFPEDFRKLLPKEDFLGLIKLISETSKINNTNELDTINVKSWLNQYTTNTLIHSYFYIICGLYFVIPYYIVSTGEFIRCLTTLNKFQSVGYPKGGCISIPSAYADGIRKYKGSVKTGTSIQEIVIEDDKVKGVKLDNGEFISSKIVISNAGIKETVNTLIGRKYFDKSYLKEMDNLKYSMSALTLKIALKKPLSPYKIVVSFTSEDPEKKNKSILNGKVPDEIDFFIPIPSNYHASIAPEGCQLMTAGTFVPKDNFKKNEEKWIENSMNTLEKVFPDLSKNILWCDITTPYDIETMWGKEGSVIGVSQTTGQVGINRPAISLPIKGLYMVGGDAGGWGIGTELAAQSALECSEIILKKIHEINI